MMLHFPIDLDRSNAEIKSDLYELIKNYALFTMTGPIVIIDLPGEAYFKRQQQFAGPDFLYTAAEKVTRIRWRICREAREQGLPGFVSDDWFKLAAETLTIHKTGILSYDGTESVGVFINKGRFGQFNELLHKIEPSAFIINLCLSRRLNHYDLQGLDPISPELTDTQSCIEHILYNMKLVLNTHDYEVRPILLGEQGQYNTLCYGRPRLGSEHGGANMVNIILPCYRKKPSS